MFTWKRLALAVLALITLAMLFLVLILPGIVRDRAQRWVAEETGRVLEIGAISLNPIQLAVEIRQLSLSEQDHSQVFVSWDVLKVALSPKSLLKRAPIVRELYLQKPYVHLEKLPGNRFNYSDLLPAPDETAGTDEKKPALFSINNLVIHNGSLDLDDRSLEEDIRHTVREFELAVPFIGNLPYLVDRPVQPLVKALVNDAPVRLDGTLKPFAEAQELEVRLALDNIDLPYYLAYVPLELPVILKSGHLSFDLDLRYRMTASEAPRLTLGGQVDLTILDIYDRLDQQLFFLPMLRCELAPSNLLDKDIRITSLNLFNLEVRVNRDAGGIWNHARLKMPAPPKEVADQAQDTGPEEGTPLKLSIDALTLRDGLVSFRDDLPSGGFASVAREINVDVKEFSLEKNRPMPLSLALETERGESLTVNGELTITPLVIALDAHLKHVPLAAYLPYYQSAAAVPLGGKLDARAHLAVTPDEPFLLRDGKVELSGLSVPFTEKEGVDVRQIALDGLSYKLASNSLELASAAASGTRLRFSRDRKGTFSFQSDNLPILAGGAPPQTREPSGTGPAFKFRVDTFHFDEGFVDFRDRFPEQPAHLRLDSISLEMSNLAMPEKISSPFKLSASLPPKGQLRFDGTLRLAEQRIALNGRLRRLPLLPLAPYLSEQTDLILTDGTLDARLSARAASTAATTTLAFNGDLGISRLHLIDKKHREDLVKWESLQITGAQGELSPLQLTVDSVTLSDYFAKVLIDQEAKLNLVEAFRREDAQAADKARDASGQDGDKEAQAPRPQIRIDTIVLQGGQVDFTDRNLPRPFHADMRKLGGRITGLSSAADASAEIDLRGSLRNQSPLSITGRANPLAEDLFLDLKMDFTDIEMSPFSPYSGTFAGYLIEKGKLNLALEYAIDGGQLKATNKVFLDQFTFGDAVESDKATSLPVKLAVALLKDRKGEIHLDIPVQGSLDDPQFSIAGVVWTVIKNLLVKAATSPLALLGALVGGGDEDFSTVAFDYGSSRLLATEEEKLARLAQALAERPGLKIEAKAFIDPENDPEGYRRETLAARIRELAYREMVSKELLPEGTDMSTLAVPAEDYADYLWDIYRQGDFPKPRNFIGMIKKLPVEEMEKLLYVNTTVDQDTLAELALARAVAVQNYLTVNAGLAKDRVFLTRPDITAVPDKEGAVRARVELGTSVR